MIGVYIQRKDYRESGYVCGIGHTAWQRKATPFDSVEDAKAFIKSSGFRECTQVPDTGTNAYVVEIVKE